MSERKAARAPVRFPLSASNMAILRAFHEQTSPRLPRRIRRAALKVVGLTLPAVPVAVDAAWPPTGVTLQTGKD